MKFKTTAKAIRENGGRVLACGYCGMQNLLYYRSPIAYTSGVYGWNFDVYDVDGYIITTGYRGMVGQRVDYERLREYELKAEKIVYDHALPYDYDERRAKVDALLREFLAGEFNR